jgi:hypothetical protein
MPAQGVRWQGQVAGIVVAGLEKRRGVVLATAALVVAVAGVESIGHTHHKAPVAAAQTSTVTVERTNLSDTETISGTLGYGAVTALTGQGAGTITSLPAVGATVSRGQALYQVDDQPVVVFYGATALFRTLRPPEDKRGSDAARNADISVARQTLRTAELQQSGDRTVLREARSLEATGGRSTLLETNQQLSSDKAALAAARSELANDERLGCPVASSSTVGSPSGSAGSAGSTGDSGTGTSGAGGGTAGEGSVTSNLEVAGRSEADDETTTTVPPVAPSVTGEGDGGETTTTATVSGTITANGLDTTYFFEYGTTTAYGSTTPTVDVDSGSAPVEASVILTGLAPGTTYLYRLVAANADGTTNGVAETFATAQSSCVEQQQTIRSDEQAVTDDTLGLAADRVTSKSTVSADEHQLATDQATEQADAHALQQAEDDAPKSDTTELQGNDVRLVAQNLSALGYYDDQVPSWSADVYTPALAAAVKKWQVAVGMSATGTLTASQIFASSGPVRVTAVQAQLGDHVSEALLSYASTAKVITVPMTPSQAGQIYRGMKAIVTLPDGTDVSGSVTAVSQIVQANSGDENLDGGTSSPTVNVTVTPLHPRDVAKLQSAPVNVSFVTATHKGVLGVPVTALLAVTGGGYALQRTDGSLVSVTTGLFANGMVEVDGKGVVAGLTVKAAT